MWKGERRMKKTIAIVAAFVILLGTGASVMAGSPEDESKRRCSKCSPAGIWYGGADLDDDGLYFKWILNVTPQKQGDGYQITGYAGWGAGVPIATPMNGVSKKIGKNKFEFYAIGYQNTDAAYPPITPPTIIAVHGIMTLVDCNTNVSFYDFQGIYDWGMEPFVDQPIVDLGTWVEEYKRMPTPDWPPDW
jgi:hypothetical protein